MLAKRLTSKSRIIIDFPFLLFVYLADADDSITVESVECFERLLHRRQWCRSKLLKKSLRYTLERRDLLWNGYIECELTPDLKSLKAQIQAILNALDGKQRDRLADDLLFFLREMARISRDEDDASERGWVKESDFHELALQILSPDSSPSCLRSGRHAHTATQRPDVDFRRIVTTGVRDSRHTSGQDGCLHCVQVVAETHDVKTFCFLMNPAARLSYLPGQFITLKLPIGGRVVHGSYTISSSPSRPIVLSITVKRVEGGLVSNWLHENLSVGDEIHFSGPAGEFSCASDMSEKFLFISAGCGITPGMSMLRWLYDRADDRPVTFIHCARTNADLVYYDEIVDICRAMPNFRHAFLCSRPAKGHPRSCRTGHIDLSAIREICPDFGERATYVCGPSGFMEATRQLLYSGGLSPAQFHQESFSGPSQRSTVSSPAPNGPVNVSFPDFDRTEAGTGSETVLEIADRAGIEIPSACRLGQCGTCRIILVDGQVHQDCTDGLTEEELAAGRILGCQARPVSDIEVRLDE